MKIRFSQPAPAEASRGDMLRVHYAPARRPDIPFWRWTLLLALLLLPFAWSVAQAVRHAVTLELAGQVQVPAGQVGGPLEVMATAGIEQAGLLQAGRAAELRFPGRGWVRAQVVALRLVEADTRGHRAEMAVGVWLRPLEAPGIGVWHVGDDRAVAVRFSLLQDLRAWWMD